MAFHFACPGENQGAWVEMISRIHLESGKKIKPLYGTNTVNSGFCLFALLGL